MNSSHQDFSEAGWQVLGKLTLFIESDNTSVLQTWLTELLAPLNLSMDFFTKVLNSAQDAVDRAGKPTSYRNSDHLHLIVFVSTEPNTNKKNWGFFQVDKIETNISPQGNPEHAIEIYLYLDGK